MECATDSRKSIYWILFLIFYSPFFANVFLLSGQVEETSKSSDGKKIKMVFTQGKNEYTGRWTYLVFTEAFRRLGKELVFETCPPKRCSFWADEGKVDGELGRIYSYAESHPNLVRVEEPVTSIYWTAFTVNPEIRINGWESLRGTHYKVEYRWGLSKAKNKLDEIVQEKNLSHVNNANLGLKKLLAGRSEIYVDIEGNVQKYLAREEFKEAKILNAGILEEETIHVYLHKKNKAYAQPLSDILKQMRHDGFFEAYENLVQKETAAIITTDKLMNGGFEDETAGRPEYWIFSGPQDSMMLDKNIQASGNYSMQIYLRTASRGEASLYQEVEVEAGKRYDFGGELKVSLETGSAKIMVIFFDLKGNEISSHSLPQLVDNMGWIYQHTWIKSPNGADRAKIICLVRGQGKAWFDKIHFSTKIRGGY